MFYQISMIRETHTMFSQLVVRNYKNNEKKSINFFKITNYLINKSQFKMRNSFRMRIADRNRVKWPK